MSDFKTSEWIHPRGVIDGGTAIVVLLWVGILFLVPERPVKENASPPVSICMISAWPEPLSSLPLDLHPDLVTLPSAVSFGAGGPAVDSLQGVPSLRRYTGKPLPTAVSAPPSWDAMNDADSLREAAVASVMQRPVFPVLIQAVERAIMTSSNTWRVLCSRPLGDTQLSRGFRETFLFPQDVNHFEAELWVQFNDGGVPQEIFVETTDDKEIAQRVVRQLWNPVNWTNATGQGGMSIRYLAGTGGMNANQEN